MNNNVYNRYNNSNTVNNSQNLQQQGQAVLNQLNQMGLTPEQAVRQMLQNGGISQQQFQQYAVQADQALGKRR
jgi:hypothetical protein